jgi:hypothetical protein
MVGENPTVDVSDLDICLKFELKKLDLPTCYYLQNVWVLVDATVVYYNYQVWH